MLNNVLRARLQAYSPANAIEQENVLQELMQHYVLAALSRAGLFEQALFHGGTCLRIIHGLSRFSEDLDFLLKRPDPSFRWQNYLDAVTRDCAQEGIAVSAQNRSSGQTPVQKAFVKTDAIGTLLQMDLPFERHRPRTIRVKLEIDANPPAGSTFATSYITFPVTAALTTQTLESGFALKLHALLCRTYAKGRDWYDFVWYAERGIRPDFALLSNALHQQGPWAGQSVMADLRWLHEHLEATIRGLDWTAVRADVQRFLPLREQDGLRLWGVDFFLQYLSLLRNANAAG